tara:strand:+ start:10538 stop:12283 length:1746 start_codon:yes stop_codon:yes gene_type:complete
MKTFENSRYGKKLAVVCCYYNPCNYSSRFLNYITFIENLKRHNIHTVTVEAYSFNSKYRVDKLNINTISVRSTQIYWMKECLLNIGIQRLLDDGYENIVWLDADIIFKSTTWPETLLNELSMNNVVQVFDSCYESTKSGIYDVGNSTISLTHDKKILEGVLGRVGELGYGYAYNSNILSKCKLYDSAILGAGDFANILGCVYESEWDSIIRNDRFFHNTSEDFTQDYINWAKQMSHQVSGKVGYCKEDINVLHHGNRQHRNYISRENIIKHYKFRPTYDLTRSPTGLYIISNRLMDMTRDIERYFKNRKEDDELSHELKLEATTSVKNANFYTESASRIDIQTPSSYLVNYKNIHTTDYTQNYSKVEDYILNKNVARNKPVGNRNTSKSDYNFLVVCSRHTKSPIPLVDIPRVVYSKSGMIVLGEYAMPTHRHSVAHTYLSYIVNEYNELPRHILFFNDITMEDKVSDWVNSSPTSTAYKTYTNTRRRIAIGPDGHLKGRLNWLYRTMKKSKYDFKTWVTSLLPGIKIPTRYTPGSTFSVSRDVIRKRSINFYRGLLNAIPSGGYCEEEHYFECCWESIFS